MSSINDSITGLFEFASKDAPREGKRVSITGGRKHKGKAGVVKRHQKSKFDRSSRYTSGMMAHGMTAAIGKIGYVCLVEQDNGDTFWVDARWAAVEATR